MSTPSRSRILVVEDETHLAQGIAENLQAEGHDVDVATDGASGLERGRTGQYDLVVLDVMLPQIDGFTLCQTLRQEGNDVPVLFLTAKSSNADRIHGLEIGGDDYLPKPFHLKELLLRVAAILRRGDRGSGTPGLESVEFTGNEFSFRAWRGTSFDGTEQVLTYKEAMILKVLAERDGEVVSREQILELVWGHEVYPSTRTIDNFVMRLRRRFERDPESPRHFHTVRGVGYRFTREPEEPSS